MQHNVLFKKERTLEKSTKKINDKNLLLQVNVICWNIRRGVFSKPNYILYRCVDVA